MKNTIVNEILLNKISQGLKSRKKRQNNYKRNIKRGIYKPFEYDSFEFGLIELEHLKNK